MFDPMMAGALLALVTSAGILGAFALACACMAYLQRRAPVEAGDAAEPWGNKPTRRR